MKMKSDTQLDYAEFQLTPTRTRCEFVASAGDESEKLASGLIQPFLSHIKEASDQIAKGGCSIKLEPPPGDGDGLPSWFTKGTLERFVRFVSTPEVLERACSIEDELLQLEESLQKSSCGMNEELQPGTPTSQSPDSSVESNGQSNLTKALELRRSTLYKEQSLAFARAAAAGFILENMASLMEFSVYFGAQRLQDACEKYMKLCIKKREREIWLGDSNPEIPEQIELLNDNKVGNGHSVESPLTNGVENGGDGGAPVLKNSGSDEEGAGEMLSVQEKISMFEGQKSRAFDKRRKSAEIARTEPQKQVLRRWSLAVEKFPQVQEEEAMERVKAMHEEEADESSEEVFRGSTGNGDSTQQEEIALETPSKNSNLGDSHHEEQKSVSSEPQSLKDSKGRFYDQYREKRDAKMREEASSLKAEKQARMVAMQETLERRRAEVAKSLRVKKNDPLAEARVRAEKLRAFKASLAETKKAKEEEERKRFEELRIQRQQKKVSAPGSPVSSPRQVSGIPGKPSSSRGLFPTFQRSSSFGTKGSPPAPAPAPAPSQAPAVPTGGSHRVRRSWSVVSQSVPSLGDLKHQQQQESDRFSLRKAAVIKSSKASMRSSNSSSSSTSSSNKMPRNPVMRKSVSSLERDEGLKFLGGGAAGGGGESLVLIRAPVTAAEEEEDVENNGGDDNENEGGSTGGESEEPQGSYNAPVAPISISPMLLNV